MLVHLFKYNLIAEEQGGFLPKKGIFDTIGKFLGDIYDSINSNSFTLSIFFDFKKAFDTMDHSILLQKLYYGLLATHLKLLTNYRSDHYHTTRLNNTVSNKLPVPITDGFPQGSTLGPLYSFFILMTFPYSHADLIKQIVNNSDGEMLEIVHEYKYLGVILDEHLTFHNHVSYLYQLNKIRTYIDTNTALILYKSMICLKLFRPRRHFLQFQSHCQT